MLIKNWAGWELPDAAATPEAVFLDRRRFLGASGLALGALAVPGAAGVARAAAGDPTANLYPAMRNLRYRVSRELTKESVSSTYNNFYEFGSHKRIADAAQALPIRPWTVRIDGLVEKEQTIDFDRLIRMMPLEERLYRHRCVEAWSMTVPWTGFPLRALLDLARPLGSAKYVEMQTFLNPEVAPGQKQFWYPWPYVEGLTIAEAANELAFLVTGVYGKPMAKQFGAPLRLAVPWKYGFKSVKSIVLFRFTEKRPKTFWEEVQPKEYGFWANVNPDVAHPRWSQATEKLIGTSDRTRTHIYNGYGEFVAQLYAGMKLGDRLFR
ncbi:MAG: protein-methionine-sulfoxide reductase catalytic subunit MsrP [Alphaproteobacteria bacterium]|jgi:sulfoxide reductase catalytic subunit YedY|nr:protein-methionine-sulfoxide reductase catalytic subunit MsrP [Alphaproteobacteria bacterium]